MDSGAFGSLRQISVDFINFGSCLSCLGLGKGNEVLLFLCSGLNLTSCYGDFFVLDQLGLCVLCGLLLGMELGFGGTVKAGKGWTRAKGSVDLTFLWSCEQGKIILKNILTAVSTEASDGSGSRPARRGEIAARRRSPNGRKPGRAVVGKVRRALKLTCTWEGCKLAEEVVM